MIEKLKAMFQANPWLAYVALGGAGIGAIFVLTRHGSQSASDAAAPSDASVGLDATGDPSLSASGDPSNPGTAPSWYSNAPSWYTNPPADNDSSSSSSSGSTGGTKKHPKKNPPVKKHPVTRHPAKKTITERGSSLSRGDNTFNRKTHMTVQGGVAEHAGDFSTGAATHERSLDMPGHAVAALSEHVATRRIVPAPEHVAHPAHSAHKPAPSKNPKNNIR